MSVQYMSFSAHADAKGIMQLIQHCEPSKVLLVHGEASKMEFLKKKITQELGKYIYCCFVLFLNQYIKNIYFIFFSVVYIINRNIFKYPFNKCFSLEANSN